MPSKENPYSGLTGEEAVIRLISVKPLIRVSEAAALLAPGTSPARIAADSGAPLGAHLVDLSSTGLRMLADAIDRARG